mmetsp:Transcript_12306/g.22064  ORF Transcript_12306/g.22064 Transcript_12306/m.22064 type:complete len:631 (-) Transcript_12306:36-1928(-)
MTHFPSFWLALLVLFWCALSRADGHDTPNIILILTDDQDVTANSLDSAYMPRLNRLFRSEGMEFLNYYVSTALCCPSRASIFRGQNCHNTKIFDNGDLNNATYQSGSWEKFLDTGLEDETFLTFLQSAGYETALVGKYMNGYLGPDAASHKPPGFDHFMGMMKTSYYGATFSDNGKRVLELNETAYQTDFVRDWAIEFLKQKRNESKPFFLMMTPFAPHAPATPAKRHENMFHDTQFPRFDSFNPSDDIQHQRPAWIKNMPPLAQAQIDSMDNFYRNRLRALQAVDEALEDVVGTVKDLGLDKNTFVVYTSDNGQHFGDFRIPAGKRQAYETDVLVPFFVRGPGIRGGSYSTQVVQSVDLVPTFLEMATFSNTMKKTTKSRKAKGTSNVQLRVLQPSYPMDGKSILPLLTGEIPGTPAVNNFRWAALLEMYGGSSGVGQRYQEMKNFYQHHFFPNTYQAVRVVNGPSDWAGQADWLYVEWCTGEQEFYNMTSDPYQTRNLAVSSVVDSDDNLLRLLHRLSRLLGNLGNCRGSECHEMNQSFELPMDEYFVSSEHRMLHSLDELQASIRNKFPCFNPPNMTKVDINLGRKSFAVDLHVPEPFAFGFPFSDEEYVPESLLQVWEEYRHYFHS